jgi:transcriptional regulator with XRE-family HTH domain
MTNTTQIARAFGVAPAEVENWKRGYPPRTADLVRIAELIGQDYETVFRAANHDIGHP